ncbi:DNA (cytosine-5-)-methyltransferase [Mycoplasmopsis agassizii]|uniref:Cytosine-specific methyltransferase n=1 Tax=Mycoplasmopsis agassizii TaxID=33922 RepID=A0A269TK32_9BACT|nr:DNA cytosine methyltransferase [Mycoplasmopsis agassizii]PAK21115.1 DNA (cytosine-5-)-methyltransferase [Mycoplasmopsis agassizii]
MSGNYFKINYNTIPSKKILLDNHRNTLNVVSLFSGAGGMDLGFRGDFEYLDEFYESNNYNLIFANDIFEQAADVYEANFNHKVERKDIANLDLNHDLPNLEVDVILGGFPCQTFSYSGKRAGISDKRGQLYLQMIRVIDHYQPKIFVAENVDGIRNSKKNINGETIDKSALDIIIDEFKNHGYDVKYKVLNAADYGVPQNRKRVIIIGLRSDLGKIDDSFFPKITHDETSELTGNKWRTSKDAIDDLWNKIDDPSIFNHTSKDISRAKFYPNKKMQGNNRIYENKPAPTIRAEHHGNIEAHYKTYLKDPNDMNGWRRLSVRECARLQSFPDSFNFNISASAAYKAIGNAVPPLLAWHIARSIFQAWKKLGLTENKMDNSHNKLNNL